MNNIQELIELVDNYGANWEGLVEDVNFETHELFPDFCDYLWSLYVAIGSTSFGTHQYEGYKVYVEGFSVTVMTDSYIERFTINENLDREDVSFDDFEYTIASYYDSALGLMRYAIGVFGGSVTPTIKNILGGII